MHACAACASDRKSQTRWGAAHAARRSPHVAAAQRDMHVSRAHGSPMQVQAVVDGSPLRRECVRERAKAGSSDDASGERRTHVTQACACTARCYECITRLCLLLRPAQRQRTGGTTPNLQPTPTLATPVLSLTLHPQAEHTARVSHVRQRSRAQSWPGLKHSSHLDHFTLPLTQRRARRVRPHSGRLLCPLSDSAGGERHCGRRRGVQPGWWRRRRWDARRRCRPWAQGACP